MSVLEYTADGSRLDVLLSQDGALSRSRAAELIKLGAVSVNGRVESKPSAKPAPGAPVRAEVPEHSFSTGMLTNHIFMRTTPSRSFFRFFVFDIS